MQDNHTEHTQVHMHVLVHISLPTITVSRSGTRSLGLSASLRCLAQSKQQILVCSQNPTHIRDNYSYYANDDCESEYEIETAGLAVYVARSLAK